MQFLDRGGFVHGNADTDVAPFLHSASATARQSNGPNRECPRDAKGGQYIGTVSRCANGEQTISGAAKTIEQLGKSKSPIHIVSERCEECSEGRQGDRAESGF